MTPEEMDTEMDFCLMMTEAEEEEENRGYDDDTYEEVR